MLDAVDIPIIVISRDCAVARINSAATTVFGLTASDVGRSLGHTFATVEKLDRLCAQVISDGVSCRREIRNGDRYFLLRIAPYAGSDGQILGAVLTFTNITAFRASIDQAIYEREYTKAILNTVVDPLVVLDAKLHVQTANRAFYTLFGISRDATQGISIRKMGNTDWENSQVWKSIATTLSEDTEFQPVELHREFPTIGVRTVVLDARRLARDGDALILVAFQDITRQKQSERSLRESEERFRAIVETTPECVKLVTADGTLLHMNSSGLAMVGADSAESVVGKSVYDLIEPNDRERYRAFNEAICRGQKGSLEFAIIGPHGVIRHMETHAAPLLNPDGTVAHLGVSRDITERKTVHEELQKSEERFRALADALDAQVQARTQELQRRNLEVVQQAEQLRELSNRLLQSQDDERRRVARELHDGVGQVLAAVGMNLAKLDKERYSLSLEARQSLIENSMLIEQVSREIRTVSHLLHPPMLDEIGLESALRWYGEGFSKRSKIAVDMKLAPGFSKGLPREVALSLYRVVQECLTNIHRHSGSKTASVTIKHSSVGITLEVKDQGAGISTHLQAQLAAGQGSGLGLRGMRERIQQLGGRLEIDSNKKGARIVAVLPVTAPAPPEKSQSLSAQRTVSR
jgi:PAS domain S-box-containing protein